MDAGFPEKIKIRQKVRAPIEPIRSERAIRRADAPAKLVL